MNAFRRISALLGALALTLALATPASAATVTFNSKDDVDVTPGSGYHATDLFTNFKNVMPGDTIQDTVTITNSVRKSSYIKVYLKAVPHDEEKNPPQYSEKYEETDGKDQKKDLPDGLRDETVASMEDFLAQLTLTVREKDGNGKVIYTGHPNDPGTLDKKVYLGKLNRNKSMKLHLTLGVPIEMGNDYALRVGEVDWVFSAEIIEGDNLIQTGQLNWPIPVLGTLGAALIFFGVVTMRKKKKDENA